MVQKASHKTERGDLVSFQQIVNVGPSIAEDFQRLGLRTPQDLIGKDPWYLFESICRTDGIWHDACVLDVFCSAVDYMNGNAPKKWWEYTSERKSKYSRDIKLLRSEFE